MYGTSTIQHPNNEERGIKMRKKQPMKEWLALAGITLLFTAVSCDLPSGLSSQSENTGEQKERFGTVEISYDQQTHRFTTQWPASIIRDGLMAETEGQMLLDHYEAVHERMILLEDGTIETETQWIEGHAEMGLPEDLYLLTEEERPALPESFQEVRRSTIKDGLLTYLEEDGTVLYEFPVDADSLWADPAWFDADSDSGSSDTQERIAHNLQKLTSSGLAFRLEGDAVAIVEQVIEDPVVSMVRSRIDLETGLTTAVHDLDALGRLVRSTSMHYENVSGFPVLKNKMTLRYGDQEGAHTLLSKTLTSRSNITLKRL